MKKRMIQATLVAVFTLIAGYNVYSSQKTIEMSELVLANVEAIAADEIRCVDDLFGNTLFYCKSNMMTFCYCDGARPGSGYQKVTK